ncbi:MAG: thermonuclease family protein, partial [Aeromicrobium sp.]
RNYQYAPMGDQPSTDGARGVPEARASKPWVRRWEFWLVAACVAFDGMTAIGVAATPADTDLVARQPTQATEPAQKVDQTTPSAEPTSTPDSEPTSTPDTEPTDDPVVLLFVSDQKDGDSWVASDGKEYRLGLINTPERNEQCGPEATAYTRKFLSNGFTVDAYATDNHGRAVAEVRDRKGRSLNVKLAKSGLGDGRYLEQFRHENPDLGRRLDRALASASVPACRKTAKPVPLVPQPRKTEAPKSDCMSGYSPCLPVVADLDCGEIGHPVTVTGSDPYRLDADGDGIGCD